jgi:GNAT superfamily N-acetyltransferase
MSAGDLAIRTARAEDIEAICAFGSAFIPDHYEPPIGAEPAHAQVERWWNKSRIGAAVDSGQVVVATSDDEIVGVAERGHWAGDHVVWKLYGHPDHRGRRIGPRLLAALIEQLPPEADRLLVEHFAANVRAGTFFAREGFRYLRAEPGAEDRPSMAVVWRALDLRKR